MLHTLGAVAAVVLLVGGCTPAAQIPARVQAPPAASVAAAAAPVPSDAGADFARAYRAEAEALASPPRLFDAQDQIPPPGFVPLERRAKVPERFHEARMFAFD